MQLLHSSHPSCRLIEPVSHNVPQHSTQLIHRLSFSLTRPSRTRAARSRRAQAQDRTLGPTARAAADQLHDDPRAAHLAHEAGPTTAHSEVQRSSDSQRAHGASLHGQADAAQQLRPTAQTLEELGRDFDWKGQWYPVSFTCNLREGAVINLPLAHKILVELLQKHVRHEMRKTGMLAAICGTPSLCLWQRVEGVSNTVTQEASCSKLKLQKLVFH